MPDVFDQVAAAPDSGGDIFDQVQPEPSLKTSATGAFARSAATGVLPAGGAAVGGAAGAASALWLAGLAGAPETGGLSFLIPLAGTLIGGMVGAGAAAKAQKEGLKAVAPETAQHLEELEAADTQQHPMASIGGSLAANLPTFELAPGQTIRGLSRIPRALRGAATTKEAQEAASAALQVGLGAGQGVVMPLLHGQAPTAGGVAESVAQAALFGHPRLKALRYQPPSGPSGEGGGGGGRTDPRQFWLARATALANLDERSPEQDNELAQLNSLLYPKPQPTQGEPHAIPEPETTSVPLQPAPADRAAVAEGVGTATGPAQVRAGEETAGAAPVEPQPESEAITRLKQRASDDLADRQGRGEISQAQAEAIRKKNNLPPPTLVVETMGGENNAEKEKGKEEGNVLTPKAAEVTPSPLPTSIAQSLSEAEREVEARRADYRERVAKLPDGATISGWTKKTIGGDVFWLKGKRTTSNVLVEAGQAAVDSAVAQHQKELAGPTVKQSLTDQPAVAPEASSAAIKTSGAAQPQASVQQMRDQRTRYWSGIKRGLLEIDGEGGSLRLGESDVRRGLFDVWLTKDGQRTRLNNPTQPMSMQDAQSFAVNHALRQAAPISTSTHEKVHEPPTGKPEPVEQLAPEPAPTTAAVERQTPPTIEQHLSTEKRPTVTAPEGATQIRITDQAGRKAIEPLVNLKKANPFLGVEIAKVEAGTIDKSGKFKALKGEVSVKGQEALPATAPETTAEPAPAKPKGVGMGRTMRDRLDFQTESTGPDILDWLANNMKLVSKSAALKRGQEWWRQNASLYDEAPGKLSEMHHNAIYGGVSYPDQAAQAAFEAGMLKEPSASELWRKVKQASEARSKHLANEARQTAVMEAEIAAHEAWSKATQQEAGKVEVTTEDLVPGDLLEVAGERVEVTRRDPESGDVTLKDGRTFGEQKLEEGHRIYVEKFEPKSGGTPEFLPEEKPALTLDQPESVEEQKARLAKEAEAKAKKAAAEKLAAESAKPLIGSVGDIGQGDLLGGGDLFSGAPKAAPAPEFPSLLEYAKSQYAKGGMSKEITARLTDESQVESFRPQWEKEQKAFALDQQIAAQQGKAEQAARDMFGNVGTFGGNPARIFRYYQEELSLMRLYLKKGFLVAGDAVEKFAGLVGRKVNAVMVRAWGDANGGTEAEAQSADELPRLSQEELARVAPDRTTTQVAGAEMEIGSRPGTSAAADAAAVTHQHQMIDEAGRELAAITKPGPKGTVTFEPDGFLKEAEGQRLLDSLTRQLPDAVDGSQETPYHLSAMFKTIQQEWANGNLKAVFGEPIARRLFKAVQSTTSQWGLMLHSLQRFGDKILEIARDPLVHLQYQWGESWGGQTWDRFFGGMQNDLAGSLPEEARGMLDPESPSYIPNLGEFLGQLQASQNRDTGGRVYRTVQQLLKPKSAKKISALEASAKVQEAVAEIVAQAARQGITPKPRPGKKALTPLEQFLHLVTPENAENVDGIVQAAVKEAEFNAGWKAMEGKISESELLERKQAGEDPPAAAIEEGFNRGEYAHWRGIRNNLLEYSPTTVKLAQAVLRGDFKGTKFKPTPEKLADLRIDLAKLAVSPEAEVARVLNSWHAALGEAMDLRGASTETKLRMEQMMRSELAGQLERLRGQVRDPLFAEKVKRGTPLTPEEVLKQKINAGLFADPRLDLPGMVERVAGKPAVNKLLPTMGDLIGQVFQTPFYRQEELRTRFVQQAVQKLGIDASQADKAWSVFEQAFSEKFAAAKGRAAEQAIQALSVEDREVIRTGDYERVRKMANAGNLDSADLLQKIAERHGARAPTDAEAAKMKGLVGRIEQLGELNAQDRAVLAREQDEMRRMGGSAEQVAQLEADFTERKADAMAYQIGALKKELQTMWARLKKPINLPGATLESWSKWYHTRQNLAEAANVFEAMNLLLKTGFTAFRLPVHLTTQVLYHAPSRAIARVMTESGFEWNQPATWGKSTWEQWSAAFADGFKGMADGIKPGLIAARAEMRGRGEGRNVDHILSGVQAFERALAKARAYDAAGDPVRATIFRLMALPRVMQYYVSGIDQMQGNPAESADILHKIDMEMVRQGRSRAEIQTFKGKISSLMRTESASALAETQGFFDREGIAATPNQVEEAASKNLKARIYQAMAREGLPADAFREQNEGLRQALAWQEQVKRGLGGGMTAALRLPTKAFGLFGLPNPFGAFANAIGSSINYSLMNTPFYKLADVNMGIGGAPKHTTWFKTDFDRKQRLVHAMIGTAGGMAIGGLIMAGKLKVNLFPPRNKEERDEFDAGGHKSGTVEFVLPDGSFIPFSMLVGPFALYGPYLSAFGGLKNMLMRREKEQAKLNAEAAAKGLTPGKIRDISAVDWLGVAGQTAYGTLLGNRTASGLTASVTEYGIPNARKAIAGFVAPAILGLPGLQEISRMAGVAMDSHLATVWDYLVPLPTSQHRAVNLLGDPVGTPNGLQRVLQVITSGSYPGIVDPKEELEQAGYAALAGSGFRPPAIVPGKGYNVNGVFRPFTDTELANYTENRGKAFKAALSGLGAGAGKEAVAAAFEGANSEALASVGAGTAAKKTVSRGTIGGSTQRTAGGLGKARRRGALKRSVGAGRLLGLSRSGRAGIGHRSNLGRIGALSRTKRRRVV